MKTFVLAMTAAAGLAGAANAAFFSFASDTANRQWTFKGLGNTVTQGDVNGSDIDLILNNDNGGAQVSIATKFFANWTLTHVSSTNVGPYIAHSYRATGMFEWRDASTGAMVLRGDFTDALFTATGRANSWDSTATVMGADSYTQFGYTSGINDPSVGMAIGAMSGPQDFGFTLTVINTSGALPYIPNSANRGSTLGADLLPNRQWWSEGSFSGSAVPTPGSVALLGLGGLLCAKRNRKQA
jgi:hypothetical protein